jgi:membrane protease YdiL (CAAX protease family)
MPETEPATAGRLPRVPWKPWWALVFAVVAYYGSQFAAGAIVTVYPWLKHWSGAQAASWLNNSVGAQFVFILLAEVFMVGAVYYFLKRYELGLPAIGLKRPRWRDLGYGFSAVLPYYVLYLLTVGTVSHFVTGLNVNQQQNIGFTNVHGSVQLALTFISLVVLPPIAEEIMVRGFLYSSLKKALPVVWAVIGTSAIFAIAHLPEGGATGPLYIAALDTFVLSLVLIYLREKTGSLWASITLHAIKNGVAFAALFAFHLR